MNPEKNRDNITEKNNDKNETLDIIRKEKLNEIAHERQENRSRERLQENAEEESREKALERALSSKQEKEAASEQLQISAYEHNNDKPPVNRQTRELSFKATMNEVQEQMTPSSRAFSKLIHNKAVERVSEGIGATVARPNAILSGAILAFLTTLFVYIIAKHQGYPLSGFETIAAFTFGWLLGILYDFLKTMVTGQKS